MTPAELLFAAVNIALLAIAVLLLIPSLVLFIECTAALLPQSSANYLAANPPKVDVLIPAHNEESGIGATLHALMQQLTNDDRLIVVADNCTDNTAAIARELGAIVLVRHDSERRGKGYALDFGVQYIAKQPPDAVVIIDADCVVTPGTIARIAQLAVQQNRPVQATYLFEPPSKPSPKNAVSTLAIVVKNLVRPAGLRRLGMPCLLTGTGMAFPWLLLQSAPLASSNIVEDMKLGLDLAIQGYPPLFCPNAQVMSVLPQKEQAAKSQRTRWEHGHLQTITTQVPPLLRRGIQQARLDLLVLALDLVVPPLSLLVIMWVAATSLAVFSGWFSASIVPAALLGISGTLITIAVLSAWARYCRSILPAKMLLTVPLYILWKIPVYFAFLFKRQKAWVRTERDTPSDVL